MNAYQFFLSNAGYSHDPKTETPMQGRIRGARALAKAERDARNAGFSFHWSVDTEVDSSYWNDDLPPYAQYQCAMYNADGRLCNSLHGIDFGRNGSPYSNSYKRVVEAELASEGMDNEPQ